MGPHRKQCLQLWNCSTAINWIKAQNLLPFLHICPTPALEKAWSFFQCLSYFYLKVKYERYYFFGSRPIELYSNILSIVLSSYFVFLFCPSHFFSVYQSFPIVTHYGKNYAFCPQGVWTKGIIFAIMCNFIDFYISFSLFSSFSFHESI